MRQLVFEAARTARWTDAAPPVLNSDVSALVEPVVVSTCDMDAVALSGAIRFRPGTPLGHEGVCRVAEVGASIENVSVGDLVVVPWQISCGHCPRCLRGHNTYCENVDPGSCYGWGPHVARWGGFLSDIFEVPYADHMLVPLPPGLDPLKASGLSDNLVDAWRAVVPPLRETNGRSVLIIGSALADGGSIGLYATAFAADAGADTIVFVSPHPEHRRLASLFGATAIDELPSEEHRGFDVTADTSGTAEGLSHAISAAGPHGVCTCTSGAVHRHAPPPVPVYDMYMNNVSLRTGWVNTRSLLSEPMSTITAGGFDPVAVATTHRLNDAVDAMAEPFIKLILVADPENPNQINSTGH
jgi:alcohol dehydrogenase